MPDLSNYEAYLFNAFLEIGMCSIGAMGEIPLPWSEIDAFARQSASLSSPWEAHTLILMSSGYLRGKDQGKDPFCKAPMERSH